MTSLSAPAATNDARLGSRSNGHQQRRHCSQRKRKLYGNGNGDGDASLYSCILNHGEQSNTIACQVPRPRLGHLLSNPKLLHTHLFTWPVGQIGQIGLQVGQR
ncbi:hypothetical protein ACLKA6_007367 [Drosophila palustris]